MLPIIEEFSSTDAVRPKAASVLATIDSAIQLYHDAYGSRHPLGAYNTSLHMLGRRIWRWIELVEAVTQQRVSGTKSDQAGGDILEATDHVLDGAMEHLDVCHQIAKSFVPPDNSVLRKNTYDHLKREIEPYRRHIGLIDNFLKHRQGGLRLIEFSRRGACSLGYFVEAPIEGGGVGPSPEIHPGGKTAFSFNRDARFHICAVHAVGARLANVLHKIDKRLVPGPEPERRPGQVEADWSKAVRLTAGLPVWFFPDELTKPYPEVSIKNGRVTIAGPSPRRKFDVTPFEGRISVEYLGDGITRAFNLPYVGEERPRR